jgi:hypothetical protein
VGPWSDVYSLGVVAYEMVAGRPPFTASVDVALLRQHIEDKPAPLRQVLRTVDGDIEQAIAKALAKDPAQRFASAGAFLKALRLRQTPVTLALQEALKTTPVLLKSRPWVGGLLLVIVAVIMGVAWPRPAAPSLPATFAPTAPFMASAPLVMPTATPFAIVIPTATIIRTATPSPTSRAATRTPTATPTAAVDLPAGPVLVKPPAGAVLGAGQRVSFVWTERELGPGEQYRFSLSKDGKLASQSVNESHWRDYTDSPAGAGTYTWCVEIVQGAQAISQAACRQVTWE